MNESKIKYLSAIFSGAYKTLLLSIVIGLFYSAPAFAAFNMPDIGQLVQNLSQTVPSLMRLLTALAYVMGMFFCVKALMEMKRFGESRTMMSGEHTLKGPLINLFVGAALLYLPSSVWTALTTFWTHPTPYAYDTGASDPWSQLIISIFAIVQLIGVVAFIRGLVLLSHLGGQGQQGVFGRAMAHIIAGALLINIYQFIQVILNTLTLGQ